MARLGFVSPLLYLFGLVFWLGEDFDEKSKDSLFETATSVKYESVNSLFITVVCLLLCCTLINKVKFLYSIYTSCGFILFYKSAMLLLQRIMSLQIFHQEPKPNQKNVIKRWLTSPNLAICSKKWRLHFLLCEQVRWYSTRSREAAIYYLYR